MNTATTPEKRAKSRDWYHANKEEYNEKRRQRYAEDKEIRERARQRAADYRKRSPKVTRQLTRILNGKTVNVYSTGQVADRIGRTPQMLRNWEANGLIPESIFEGKQRLYTKQQVDLIVYLASVIEDNDGAWTGPAVEKAVKKLFKKW